MATVKKANVPPTHPSVYVGLALAAVGLLVATYAYTGTRVYDITFAVVALLGALLALGGILAAAWGRSIMAARASRSRRGAIQAEALKMEEDLPTIAAPKEKKRFAFPLPKRAAKEKVPEGSGGAAVFAFRRRTEETPTPVEAAPVEAAAAPEPVEALAEPAAGAAGEPVRVTLRCPQCAETFSAEGARPFLATCGSCGFSATV